MGTGIAAAQHGLGSAIFGSTKTPNNDQGELVDDDGSDSESAPSTESIVEAFASSTISESLWLSAPSYSPQYLSTISEYLPPPKNVKGPSLPNEPYDGKEVKGSDSWPAEKYENSMKTDPIFDKFNQRVASEADQCVR